MPPAALWRRGTAASGEIYTIVESALLCRQSNDTVKESQRSFLLNTLLCEGDHQSTGPPRATSARTVQLEVGNRRLKAALKIPAKTRVTPHLIFLASFPKSFPVI